MSLHHGRPAVLTSLLMVLGLTTGCTSFASSLSDEPAPPGASESAEAEAEPQEIEWADCTEQIREVVADLPGGKRNLTFECGSTEVPISYDEPDSATLPLYLVRAVSPNQTDRIGSLVMNPGGPGASGLDFAVGQALRLPGEVLERFDIVGFDPRGVGLSTPVECIPDDLKTEMIAAEPRPTTDAQLDEAFALSREVAEGCAEEYPDALGAFNTVDTARDLDLIREGLGDEQLTYLGYSYGTTLGSTYAELFPDRVRALVLDAAVDPDADEIQDAEDNAAGFEAAFDAYAENCKSLVSGCPVGDNPRGYVEAVIDQAEAKPIPSSVEGEDRTATPGVVVTAVAAALYDSNAWPLLSQALVAARGGDAKGLFSLADNLTGRLKDRSYSNLLDALITINCADTDQEIEESEIRALVAEWHAEYPLFGAGSAAELYTCQVWEAERTPLPERDAEGADPILVVGTEGDPATPLEGAVDMAEDLDSGVLLTWEGQSHGAYPKTKCVTDAVNAYLIELTAPRDGTTCPAR